MFIGIPEVMQELGVGRPTAIRLVKAYIGKRTKGSWLRVPKDGFLKWVNEGHV